MCKSLQNTVIAVAPPTIPATACTNDLNEKTSSLKREVNNRTTAKKQSEHFRETLQQTSLFILWSILDIFPSGFCILKYSLPYIYYTFQLVKKKINEAE